MNYIGSKHKLNPWIFETISKAVSCQLKEVVFCDLFAGTGAVGRNFKPLVKKVIANDLEYYSFVLLRNYIGNNKPLVYEGILNELNQIQPVKGFIFENYSEEGKEKRLYFSKENGQKIDAIRQRIEFWKNKNKISKELYFFLLASLIESADKVANTASVYGAFLKKIKKSATKPLELKPAFFEFSENSHHVYQEDANVLIKNISGDVLYLDPPYNARQYGSNYHLLNTIAKYDTFVPQGKTGLRNYKKSNYCRKGEVTQSFEELIKNAQFQYVFLSYNNEGLMTEKTVQSIMKRYGKYDLNTINYQRFKADKSENRNHKADATVEYLHILEKT
ncbi:DNA adenine methylase [uncultured Planktosalinus sp.]|uniref:DNA adenine methylase n=1 Tax=uncultured Planktosalinus sp. TaxID=1810935 RepID=UPI0030DAA520